jgi:hypothetical protein
MQSAMDRRRFKRAELDVGVEIRPIDGENEKKPSITGQVKNVSLAGVYCYIKEACTLKKGEQVVCSIIVPQEQFRLFPFSRLISKGWVIRCEPVKAGKRAGESSIPDEQLHGLAVAFAPNVTALGII